MRWRPKSIRTSDTVVALIVSGIVLGLVAIAVDLVIRFEIRDAHATEAERVGSRVTAAFHEHLLGKPIPPDGDVNLIQVVDGAGHIINATPLAAEMPPLSNQIPPPNNRLITVESCPAPGGGCMMLNEIRVTADPDSPVVYTADKLPDFVAYRLLEAVIAAIWLGFVISTGWYTWWAVGRRFKPIEDIRHRLAEISVTDLSHRVPQPPGENEIAKLAMTANDTLERLEHAVEQQRRFSSDASHELRTPIAGLRAQLEAALMYPEDTDLLRTIKSALRDTDRLEAIVGDLLLLARLGTDHKIATERIDLGEMVAAELEERTGRAIIGSDLHQGVMVEGVRMQLLRVLDNLLDNAEAYGGGTIDVVVYQQSGSAVLMVTDRGPGIPPEDRERVFERFTRLEAARSRTTGGTGLGLAIARDIAAAHGGTLRIEDSKVGARFVLRLPLADQH